MKKIALSLSLIALSVASASFARPACNIVLIENALPSGSPSANFTGAGDITRILDAGTFAHTEVCENSVLRVTVTVPDAGFTDTCKFKGGGTKKTLTSGILTNSPITGRFQLVCSYG